MKKRSNNPYLRNAALAIASIFLTASSQAVVYYWDNNGATAGFGTANGTWAAPTTGSATQGWSTNTGGTVVPGSITVLNTNATTDAVNFGNGATGLAAGTVAVSGTVNSGNITFASGSGAIIVSGGTITLTASQTMTVNNASDTISSVLAGAATSMTKTGTGTLFVSGANTYTGLTVVTAGVLVLNNASALPAGGLNINGGIVGLGAGNFTRPLAATSNSANANSVHFVDNGGFAAYGADRSVNLGNAAGTVGFGSGNIASVIGTLNGKALILGASNSTHRLNWVNGLDVGGGTRSIQINDGSAAVDAEVSGVIRGAAGAGLIKNGTGTLVLSNANTISGDLTINAGTVIGAGATNSPGVTVFGSRENTRSIIVNSTATLRFSSGNILGANHTSTTAPTLVINAGGTVTNATPATNNALNTVQINGGTLAATTGSASGYGAWNLNGNVTSTGVSTISTSDVVNGTVMLKVAGITNFDVVSGALTVSAPLIDNLADSNTGGLSKAGIGSMALTATNTYTGATSVTGGTLVLSGTGSSNSSSGFTINGSGAKLVHSSSAAISPTVTVTQGTLTGSGTVNTAIVGNGSGGIISNNDGVAGAALTIGSLTFSGGASINTFGNAATPIITNSLSSNAAGIVTINPSAASWAAGSYNLISYGGGSIGGAGFSQFVLGTVTGVTPRQSLLFGNSATAITLAIGADDAPYWAGDGDGKWNIASTNNWKFSSNNNYTTFATSDNALFNDNATGAGPITVDIDVASVAPLSTTFNTVAKNYILSSSGGFGISSGSLIKSGAGSATITNTNSYTGNTLVNGGTLDISTDGAQLYSNAAPVGGASVTVTNGGVLIVKNFGQGSTTGFGAPSLGNLQNSGGQVIIDGGTLRFNNETTARGRVINVGPGGATLDVVNNSSYTWTVNPGTTVPFTGSGQTLTLTGESFSSGQINPVIAGTVVSIVKNGAATWALAGANTYSGATSINAGTLRIGNATALGAGTGALDGTTISSGATLDLGGVLGSNNTERITVSGTGVGGNGAITSSATIATPFIGVRYLTLTGDTTLGFGNRWDVGSATAANNGFVGGGFTLNLLGTASAAQASLNFLGETDLGDINVNLGGAALTNIFYIQGTTTLGRPANTMTMTGGTTFDVFTNSTLTAIDKKFDLDNAIIRINKAGAMSLPGTIKLTGAGTITPNAAGIAITASNEISGTGPLTKAGAGTLALTGANTYTGDTLITAGGLVAGANNALGTDAGITTMTANAALGLSGNINYSTAEPIIGSGAGNSAAAGVFTVGSRGFVQSVSGNNTFAGAIQINAAGTSRFGTQTGAQLTLSGPITMASGTTGVTVLFRVGDTDNDFVTLSNAGNSWDTVTQIFTGNIGAGAGVKLGITNALPIGIPVQTFSGTGAGTTLDLAGFNQEVNGLFHGANAVLKISNSHASTTSVLTLNTTADRDFGTGGVILNGATAAVQLVKKGSFAQILRGVNTYTGTTSVEAGTLTLAVAGTLSGTTGLSVSGGATFNYQPTTVGTTLTLGTASTLNLSDGSTLGLSWDSITSNRITALGAATIGTGTGVTLVMTGTPTLNTPYTILSAASGLDTGNYGLVNPTDYTLSINKTATDVIITPVAATPLTTAYWKGGFVGNTNAWSISNGLSGGSGLSNWTTDAAGTLTTALVPGAGTNVFLSASGAGASDQNSMVLGASMSINSLTVNDVTAPTTNPVTLLGTGGHTLTIAASSGAGITVNAGSGAVTLAPNLVLGAAQSWTNNSTETLTAAGAVSGAVDFTKAGTGTVNILGAAGFSSATVNAGTLYMGATTGNSTAATLGAATPVTLNGTSNLTIRRTDTSLVDALGAIGGTGSLTLVGDNANTLLSGQLNLNNASTFSGGSSLTGLRANVTVADALGTGPVTVGASAGVFFITANLTTGNNFNIGGLGWQETSGLLGALRLNSTTLTGAITMTSDARIAGGGSSFLNGKISGAFALDFFEDTAFGTITLAGANDYTGQTIVNSMGGGTTFPNLIVANSSALGSTVAGSTVFGTGTTGIGGQLTLADTLTVTGETLTLDSTALGYNASLSTLGAATWDGNVVLTGTGGLVGFHANAVAANLTVGLSNADTITGTNDLSLRGTGIGTVNSAISNGTAGIVKNDSGTWTIASTNNDFTGNVSIAGGILSVSSITDSGINSPLGAGTTISLGQNSTAAGRLQFTGATGGSSNRALVLANGTNGAGAIENTVAGQTLTLSSGLTVNSFSSACTLSLLGVGDGVLSGSITGGPLLSLVKAGTGTWTLSGANTYVGATTVNEGTLRINTSNDVLAGGLTSQLLVGAAAGTNGSLIVGSGAGVVNFGGNGYTNAAQVGINGGTGAMTINGGTVSLIGNAGTTSASLHIGVQVAGSGGTGTVTVTNGTLNVGQRILMGANLLACNGTLTLTGGTVNVGTNGTLGYTGNNPGVIIFGTGTSALNLDGGTLNVFAFKAHSSGISSIQFNGGTLKALGSPTFFLGNNGNTDAAPTATGVFNTVVKTGGAVIDTNGFNITIPTAMVLDPLSTGGGLTKNGAGSLTLSGANTYTGATSVAAGTLSLVGGSQSSAITLSPGASLGFTIGSPTSSSSTFNIGAGTIRITGTPSLASHTLISSSASIAGAPVLAVPVPGYELKVINDSLVLQRVGYASWATVNGAGANLNDDHDNDGVANGVEYFLGGPSLNTTGFTALPGVTSTPGALSVTWVMGAGYAGVYGTDFLVETSDTLTGTWTTESSPSPVSIIGNNVTYTFPTPLGTKRFARLKVTGP